MSTKGLAFCATFGIGAEEYYSGKRTNHVVVIWTDEHGQPVDYPSSPKGFVDINLAIKIVEYYVQRGNYEVAFNYYNLIKDFYENQYLTHNFNDKLFLINILFTLYLPYYIIIASINLKKFDTTLKMYEILINKRQFILI